LQINLHNYLKSIFSSVAVKDNADGLINVLDINDNLPRNTKEKLVGWTDQRIIFESYDTPFPKSKELKRRIQLLEDSNDAWVIKRWNWVENDPIKDDLLRTAKNIAVIRNDQFDHTLSLCLSYASNIWAWGDEMDTCIKEYSKNKIYIDPKQFKNYYDLFTIWNNQEWDESISVYNFEDIIQISNTREFCNFFSLEYSEFNFIPFTKEFGDYKFDMISNIDQLKKIVYS
jgi:hypothetical protein